MEVLAEFSLIVELIRRHQEATTRFEFDNIWGSTLAMLKTTDITLVDDVKALESDLDLFNHAMLQGRGVARLQRKRDWEWALESQNPLMAVFSHAARSQLGRNCIHYHLGNLQLGRPVVVPPIINIDWHYTGFSDSSALGSLAPLKSKGPLLVFADNYIYAMDANEQIPIASRDVTQSLLLFVRGLTEFIGDLEQIVVVGAPIRNQDDKTTSYLIELLYDDCQKELEELGFEGDLAFIQSKRSRKGYGKSRHDRHIFTSAGQLVVTDSLRIFKSGRPHLTDTLTMTYRQYTDASSRSGIKLHAETLAHQLSSGQRLSVVGSLNEALIARALEQLCD